MAEKRKRNEVELAEGPTALEITTYRDGEEIVVEGEKSDRFFVVLSGKVKISRRGRLLSLLGEGDVFGLESCFLELPSHVSARSMGQARVAAYDREALEFILYQRPRVSERLFSSLVRQLSQMAQAAVRDEARAALDDINIRFYEDGEVIIKEGARETDIFKLVSTEQGLEVSRNGRQIGRIRTPGEFFGEMASVLGQERSATIISRGNSVVQVYSAEHIQDMIEDHPEIARRMITTLAKRLSSAIKKISGLQKELEARSGPGS